MISLLYKLLLVLIALFFSACSVDDNVSDAKSIYDISEEIVGEPIHIIISESEKIIYEITQ